MNTSFGQYGEMNAWTSDDAKGFIKILECSKLSSVNNETYE
jgi:argininosuccinate synthase